MPHCLPLSMLSTSEHDVMPHCLPLSILSTSEHVVMPHWWHPSSACLTSCIPLSVMPCHIGDIPDKPALQVIYLWAWCHATLSTSEQVVYLWAWCHATLVTSQLSLPDKIGQIQVWLFVIPSDYGHTVRPLQPMYKQHSKYSTGLKGLTYNFLQKPRGYRKTGSNVSLPTYAN